MTLRIVNNDGNGYTTRVFDHDTGEDLTARLHLFGADLRLRMDESIEASLLTHAPHIEIAVPECQVRESCPYCGHVRGYTLASARDLDATAGQQEEGSGEDPQGAGAK